MIRNLRKKFAHAANYGMGKAGMMAQGTIVDEFKDMTLEQISSVAARVMRKSLAQRLDQAKDVFLHMESGSVIGLNVPKQPERFRLIAYVNELRSVTMCEHEGTQKLKDIYRDTPTDCFKIVAQARNEFWVINLLKCLKDEVGIADYNIYVGEFTAFPTQDAAIAAAVMES